MLRTRRGAVATSFWVTYPAHELVSCQSYEAGGSGHLRFIIWLLWPEGQHSVIMTLIREKKSEEARRWTDFRYTYIHTYMYPYMHAHFPPHEYESHSTFVKTRCGKLWEGVLKSVMQLTAGDCYSNTAIYILNTAVTFLTTRWQSSIISLSKGWLYTFTKNKPKTKYFLSAFNRQKAKMWNNLKRGLPITEWYYWCVCVLVAHSFTHTLILCTCGAYYCTDSYQSSRVCA